MDAQIISKNEASSKNLMSREKCPACNSTGFHIIYENKYDESPIKDYLVRFYSSQGTVEFEYLKDACYILCECNECNFIFQKDIPNEFLMERLYEHWIDPQAALESCEANNLEYYANYAQEIMQIIAYFNIQPSSLEFFDFGMGWGKWALMAKAFGCNSYGTELSVDRIKYAESNGIKFVKWEEIPEHKFDFINTEQVFEHISDPLQTLIHLKNSLKDNGIIKISVPRANDIKRRLKIMDWQSPKYSKNSLNAVAPLEHINYYRRSSLLNMADKAGMKEIFIPVTTQYAYTVTNWTNVKRIAINIAYPIYRNILKKQNCVFLRQS